MHVEHGGMGIVANHQLPNDATCYNGAEPPEVCQTSPRQILSATQWLPHAQCPIFQV